MRKPVVLLFLLLVASPAFAAIRYVDNAAPGGGNGQSWATAWQTLAQVTGVGAGDTVYISGGSTSKTYNMGEWVNCPSPSISSPTNFTLEIGQEAGHNGTVIFNNTAGSNHFLFFRHHVTLNGRLNGTNHFRFTNYSFIAYMPGPQAFGPGGSTGCRFLGMTTDRGMFNMYDSRATEIGWVVFDLWNDNSSATNTRILGVNRGAGSGYGQSSIHHVIFNIYYHRQTDAVGNNGNDCIQNIGSGVDIYNNQFLGVLWTGGGLAGGNHQDGIQCDGTSLRIYNNYFRNMSNYMIYMEFFGPGNRSNMQIYNNVFDYSDSVLSANPTQSIAIGAHGPGTWSNWEIFNNTFRGGNQAMAFGDSSAANTHSACHVVNNLTMTGTGGLNMWNSTQTNGTVVGNNVQGVAANYFINPANGDFHLTASATNAINAGTTSFVSGITSIDADNNARVAPWDVGAFELGAGPGDPAPLANSASIPAAGTTVTVTFSENVTVNNAAGFTINMSGGAATLTGGTVLSPTTLRFNISRVIGSTETGTISYTTVANGIEDSASQDLQTFSGLPVTNGSTVPTTVSPSFSPVTGSYFGTQNVAMTSSTSGATIRYTIDGTDPTGSSTLYSGPVPTSISTTYRAKAFASGSLDSSITQAAYEIGTWTTSGTDWKSFPVTSQTGTFTWTFRASAAQAASDVVIGLSSVLPDGFNDLGPIIQFFSDNTIKARNGATYTAVNTFTYTPGTTYEIACTINIANRTYSATAAQISGTPVVIANNYAWRSDSPVAPELDNFGMNAFAGGATVSQMAFGGAASIPTLTSATIGSNGTTLTLGFSESVVYGTGGSGGWTISTSGGAATLTPTANPTTFTVSRPIATGETGTISYVQPGNGVEAVTGGGDLATLTSFAFNNQSSADLTPPIPNPMTFSAIPSAPSSFSATMTASVATDASTPPVQYYFDETSGNPGGNDSGWTTSRTYTNNGLSPGIQYTYRVMARDSAAVPNQTTPSSSVNVTTPIVAGGKVITPAGTTGAGFFNP